jgi:hypothetical protein
MDEKTNQMAEKYPEQYRERVAEILRLRCESNQLKAARGATPEAIEDYEARMLSHLQAEPNKWNRDVRERELDEMLETARRVNAKRRAGADK